MNTIYLGDCLFVLRESVLNESIDLIYIDPPFNSKRDYNIFFDDKEIQSQRIAFEDTWTLKNISDSLIDLHTMKTEKLYKLLMALQEIAPHAFPYLVMMSLRLIELHRVLKISGSLYLHCDPTMSHYLKIICDLIFGKGTFRNEIIWHYSGWNAKLDESFNSRHDIILFYGKAPKQNFNSYAIQWVSEEEYIKVRKQKVHKDKDGERFVLSDGGGGTRVKRFLKEAMKYGKPVDDVWDIDKLNNSAKESLNYPTQKPKSLLERIVSASSNKGDIILDAFCGCGTTIDVAEQEGRNWIGIDVSPIALSLIEKRLKRTYAGGLNKYEVRGIPIDEASAKKLWQENPFAFQDWWITQFEAFSSTFGSKGADQGVDGIALYSTDAKGGTLRAAFQVKGGETVQSKDIDALIGAMQKHNCELGVFLTSANPTKPMLETVGKAGIVKSKGFSYPKVQIITLKEYFSGKRPHLPQTNITFKAAEHKGKKEVEQILLEM